MLNTGKLRGIIAEKGTSQRKVAHALGITEKTFYLKMKGGRFYHEEVEDMVKYLGLTEEQTLLIFFREIAL